jgi:hypothetical protein
MFPERRFIKECQTPYHAYARTAYQLNLIKRISKAVQSMEYINTS